MTEALAPLPVGPVKRVAFLGTPEMAVLVLRALVEQGFDVAHVITRVDKRRARGNELHPSPIKAAAIELGIPVSHNVDDLLALHQEDPIDLAVVVAYGALIKPHVLAQIPMVNLHVSLLPRWRGAAPIERALLAGDVETGVCLMQIEAGLDTGGVIARCSMPITDSTTANDIRVRLIADGTDLLITQLKNGLDPVVPQTGEPTYAEKIDASELHIDWAKSARDVLRLVRLGGAWTEFRGKRLKIHDASIGEVPVGDPGSMVVGKSTVDVVASDGSIRLLAVQPEGKPRMDVVAWINGARPINGEKLTSE